MKLKDFKNARREFRTNARRKEREIEDVRKSKIAYQDLFDASEIFRKDPDARSQSWIQARRFVDWKNLHNLSTKEVRRRVIGFLNDWHCRLPSTDELAEEIKETYQRTIPFLKALENETLQDIEFEGKKQVDGKEYSNREILVEVFENFCKIGYKFRGVAASKLLSLINPNLFVMWDISICNTYGIRAPSEPSARDPQYVPEFLPLMKLKVNSVIDSYTKDKKCSRREAIDAINSQQEFRPLAKLLDEYNWVTYSQE